MYETLSEQELGVTSTFPFNLGEYEHIKKKKANTLKDNASTLCSFDGH